MPTTMWSGSVEKRHLLLLFPESSPTLPPLLRQLAADTLCDCDRLARALTAKIDARREYIMVRVDSEVEHGLWSGLVTRTLPLRPV